MGKVTQKSAKNRADTLFSRIVRSEGQCEHCGSRANLECAHWIRRGYSHTRTNLDNAFCLCLECHRWFEEHPTDFSEWAIARRGQDTYDRLRELSRCHARIDWIAEAARLKAIARQMGVSA